MIPPSLGEANRQRSQAGLPVIREEVTPHTLRYTYIASLFAAGADQEYVADQVGHEDVTTTNRIYRYVLQRRRRGEIGRRRQLAMHESTAQIERAKRSPRCIAHRSGTSRPRPTRARDVHHRHRGELRRLLAGALVLEQSAADDVLRGVAVTKRRAPVARADQLVAVPNGEDRFVSQLDRQPSGAPEQVSRTPAASASGWGERTRSAQTMPSLNPVRTLILSARAWRRISARQAPTSSTSSVPWITWPDASSWP